jgi:phospholipid/cholesterol/gamma-HCH transport system substrate-binding protein
VVGLRSDYNFLANTIKSYVELRLQPREDKYYVIELINDPRGKTSIAQTDVDTTNPNEPAHYRTVTTTTDAFRFSLQFAKRLGPFTGRFGIKESTGGVGADVDIPLALASPWMRTLSFNLDLFDFRTNIYPRFKILAALEFYKHIWIVGGVDDIFNGRGPGAGVSTGRDYFFGAQLTFNDDDIRALLTIGGAALLGSAGR